MASKTTVYAWRVSPATRASLEEAARRAGRPVARLLDEIVTAHLTVCDRSSGAEAEQQRRLHARASQFAGRLLGSDPRRAERAGGLVRSRLRRRLRAR